MYNVGKIVDPDILEEMKEECLNKIWHSDQSTVTGDDPYNDYRTSRTFRADWRFYSEFCEQLEEWVGDGTQVTQLDLLVYDKGQTFKKHLDPVDKSRRRIWSTSTILHLSDDYVGDGLRIYHSEDGDYVVPRQEVGDTVIFPSKDTWHEAAPVEQGTRIVAVAWLGFE